MFIHLAHSHRIEFRIEFIAINFCSIQFELTCIEHSHPSNCHRIALSMGLTLASDSRIVFAGRLICLKLNLLLWHLLALIDISNTRSVSPNSPLPLVAAHRLQACDQRWQMNRKWAISSGLQNDSIAKTIVLALWSCRICMQIRRSHKFLPSSRTFRQRCWPSCASSCISQFASTRASSGVPPITRVNPVFQIECSNRLAMPNKFVCL